ncbi:MAG: hypothetical protein LBR36_06230 [Bacteroidales bacterium]|nr:hypothetical protein [Bacteroidales bacterium]
MLFHKKVITCRRYSLAQSSTAPLRSRLQIGGTEIPFLVPPFFLSGKNWELRIEN